MTHLPPPPQVYCQQQIRHLQGLRFGLYYAKLALPALATTLVLLFILKWLYPAASQAAWVILPLLLLLLLLLLTIVYQQGHWRLDAWKVAAFIDQQAGVNGRFMQAVETGQPDLFSTPLPVIRFPTVIPPTMGLAWLGLILGFVLWGWLPVTRHPLTPFTPAITPQPVAELQTRLQQLDKTQQPILAEQIEQALARMQQRSDGLTADDFHALADLNQQLLAQLEIQAQQSPALSPSLQNSVQNLVNSLTPLLQQPTPQAQHWQQLAEQAQSLSQQLQADQPPGQSSRLAEQLAQLAQQAQAASTQTTPGADNSPSPAQQQALQALRDQLGQLGQPHASPPADQPGQLNPSPGGTDREGDQAPLNFSAEATTGSTTQQNQPFPAAGQATVKLGEITRDMPETAIVDPDHSPTPGFAADNNTLFGERHYRPKHLKTLEAYFNHEP